MFPVGQQLRRLGGGRPPDDVGLDGAQFGQGAVDAGLGGEDVINLVGGHAITEQSPFHIVDRTFLERTLAGEVFGVEKRANIGRHLAAPFGDIGAIAEGCRIDDLRDETFGHQHFTKILGGRRPIGRRRQIPVGVDDLGQTFVAQADGVGGDHVNQVPGNVLGFVHGAQFGDRLRRGFIIHHFDPGQRHVRFVIGVVL